MLTDAAEQGLLRSADRKRIEIAGRALVYGFARMNLDGHFPRWRVEQREVERVAEEGSTCSSRALQSRSSFAAR
ncbi:hypothetical protein ACSHT2_12950 [Bradyrhizobium sp. PUT101]|uniref:hypothetical protein n=1 Tax=Bradyrhizobium sp. PUT101 TaxID=3447427 RepID=UPI003F83CC62